MPRLLPLLSVVLITGCTVGPNYQAPQTTAPDAWFEFALAPATPPDPVGDTTGPTSRPASVLSRGPVPVAWWTSFKDAKLDDLIVRATRANLDLRRAAARVTEARAQRRGTASDALPALDIGGGYSHVRSGAGAIGGSSASAGSSGGGTSAPVAGSSGSTGAEFDIWQAGFDASWEIDVFGRVRRAVEAADAGLAAAVEDRRDVMITLLSDVARNYVELRGFQQQARIARENLDSQRETRKVIQTRFDRGLAPRLDLERTAAQVATTASAIPTFDANARQAAHRLAVLLGLQPQALANELLKENAIPAPPPSVPVGVPADLLRRRPDVRRAERQLAAAVARIGVATADLYPRFSLAGSLGLQSTDFGSLFNYASRIYSIGPQVSWNIFDAGRIRANIAVGTAQQEQLLATYEQTVLNALREVEDALIAYQRELDRRTTLAAAVNANQRAVALANELYTAGRTDFLSVLQAERDLFQSQDALVQSDRLVSSNLIALYKALGGGWELHEQAPQVARKD
ncbi:MAG TPA: efflux transporter outer membrane subunit [Tepidisphaeraceae bacterium]|nr:efflux transporter outer membrane subunit [Tepidisphaeraceae bacterium]